MTAKEILAELKPLGSESYRKTLARHGITRPMFGVKIGDMKKIHKRIKKDYQLALDLYETGNYDAMYFAGMIADDEKMTKKDLSRWLEMASDTPNCGHTVATVAAEGKHGWELGVEWIDSKNPIVAATGWSTLSSVVSVEEDADLDAPALKKLLQRVQKTIQAQPDGVRYVMNSFVIALATYVMPLRDLAIQAAEKIGTVTCDMGDTDCQVPYAPDYIKKCIDRNPTGKKRKSAKC